MSTLQKNAVISPSFLVWKFCGKSQFPHSSGRIAQNWAETMPSLKIFTLGNEVKLRYFLQRNLLFSISDGGPE